MALQANRRTVPAIGTMMCLRKQHGSFKFITFLSVKSVTLIPVDHCPAGRKMMASSGVNGANGRPGSVPSDTGPSPLGGHSQSNELNNMKNTNRSVIQPGETGPQPDVVESATVDEINAEIGGEIKHISRAKQYHESLQAKKKSLQLKVRDSVAR